VLLEALELLSLLLVNNDYMSKLNFHIDLHNNPCIGPTTPWSGSLNIATNIIVVPILSDEFFTSSYARLKNN
jgi:hypothetical protein